MGTITATPAAKISGGSFLINEGRPDNVFTPEDFTEQHQLIAQTAEEFAANEIVPNIDRMEHKEFSVNRELVKKAGDLGLSAADTPEAYGGLQMDKVTSAIIADRIAIHGGFSATWGAHTCMCSILKVRGSELIDFVVDEMVQVYGGYGFVEEYPADRAYRDSRVNRIFEGTNEINRLVITGFLLKRAMSGQLPLMPAIKKLMDEVVSGPTADESEDDHFVEERKMVSGAKKLSLFAAGVASQKYMQAMQDQQEIMGTIADMVIETYAMESAVLRAQKLAARNGWAGLPSAMARVYLAGAIEKIESNAKKVVAAVGEGDMLRTQMAIVRRLAKHEPFNTIALRQKIAQRVIEAGKYVIA